jgi:hypothetical protein
MEKTTERKARRFAEALRRLPSVVTYNELVAKQRALAEAVRAEYEAKNAIDA